MTGPREQGSAADLLRAIHDRLSYATQVIIIGPDPDRADRIFAESVTRGDNPCGDKIAEALEALAAGHRARHASGGCRH